MKALTTEVTEQHGAEDGASALKLAGIAQWFGSNRTNAAEPARVMGKMKWVGVLFMGSACEVPHFEASSIVCNDAHGDIINLARVTAHESLGDALRRRVRGLLFHPDELAAAQERMRARRAVEDNRGFGLFAGGGGGDGGEPVRAVIVESDVPDLDRAVDYFACVWMSRAGAAGTGGELGAGLALRMDGQGGDGVKRYRSAVADLPVWRRIFRRCAFTTGDWRVLAGDMLARLRKAARGDDGGGTLDGRDRAGALKLGLYADPPFPDAGDGYLHTFTQRDHRELAGILSEIQMTGGRVVVRYYDHPLVRELYREPAWRIVTLRGRDQNNNGAKPELLIVAGPGGEP